MITVQANETAIFQGVSNETLTLAVATLIGAFLGSFSQFIIAKRQRDNEKKNLRRAIKTEIEGMQRLDEDARYFLQLSDVSSHMPTRVFESTAGDIGKLSTEEVEKIIELYNSIFSLREICSMLHDNKENREN